MLPRLRQGWWSNEAPFFDFNDMPAKFIMDWHRTNLAGLQLKRRIREIRPDLIPSEETQVTATLTVYQLGPGETVDNLKPSGAGP